MVETKMWVTHRPSRVQISEPMCTTSATLWPLAKPLLNAGHTYCMSPVSECSWYIKQCLLAFYLERVNSMATNRFADLTMFDKNAYVWIQLMLIMGVIEDKSWGKNQHWSRKWFGTQQVPRHYGRETHICVSKLGRN